MAQGGQRRLAAVLDRPKQLLEVAGEPILARTQRLVHELVPEAAITVIGWPSLEPVAEHLYMLADPGLCLVEGLTQTVPLWTGERLLVLLGDVVFSRATLGALAAEERPLVFCGSPDLEPAFGELFALSVRQPGFAELAELAASCPCRFGRTVPRAGHQGGHLRRLVWWTMRNRGLKPGYQVSWAPEVYLPIKDWTWDIDDPWDVGRLPELSGLVRAEVA
jgi:hypothetical protein